MRRKAMLILVAMLVIGGGWLAQTVTEARAAEQPRRGGDREARQPRGERGADREARMRQWRERMQERQREQLGASEEEWKILQPRIEKIQTLQNQARGGFRGMRRVGRRRRPGADPPANAPQRVQTDVEKKTEALRTLLAGENANAGAIRAALTALRKAREEVAKKLVVARKALRSVVGVRQEAQLVLMGILE